MTNPVTPNIGLNKIDRTSPSTTYFDLEKYIDQNADAVDQFAGESSEAINALEKRLDTEERREVVLQPGLQIVNAERSAPFKLSGIKGRTLVNLLGRDGDFETIIPTVLNASTISALDNTSMYSGSNSIKVTATGSETVEHYADMTAGYKAKQGSYYVLIGMLKVNKGAAQIKIYNNKPQLSPEFFISESNIVSQTGTFSLVRTAFNPIVDCDVIPRLYLLKDPSTSLYVQNGESANFDCIRIFEVSKQEYDSLGSLTYEQIAAKYPYVDSVQPVRNPYAIRYGENLLPPFYEASFAGSLAGSPYILSPYEGRVNASGVNVGFQYWIPCVPNTEYTFAVENDGVIALQDMDKDKVLINNNGGFLNAQRASIITANNAAYLHILMSSGPKGAGNYTFKNPMLTLGLQAKPFKPRENSMLALQTDLCADPVTGVNADEVFEREGQYFKLAKWKAVVLGEDLPIELAMNIASGYKQVSFSITNDVIDSCIGVKYDGKSIPFKFPFGGPDQINNSNGSLRITVANTDSGWGDNYTPTVDEIKAYFMGWRMRNWNDLLPYTGTGEKAWGSVASGAAAHWTATLPTTKAIDYSTPYQLVYRLATPTCEPIVSEGMLTFNEGDNHIEVGTGIVIRESANPTYYSANGNYYINNIGVSGSLLKNKVSSVLRVYRNGQVDNSVKIENDANAYGTQHVRFLPSDFAPSEDYSVTYLMLEKMPVVLFSGSYAANEKAIFQELIDSVQQNVTAVSMLMNKGTDKDSPGWITPTLLNGWEPYDLSSYLIGYKKLGTNIVILTGTIKNGVSGHLCVLPAGYHPNKIVTGMAISRNENQTATAINAIEVRQDGRVYVGIGNSVLSSALQFTVLFEAEK
ncbi:hypothetical protein P4H39_16490 [Paenibacillus lautus]|uniref:hypothetical protein n=1 Tax=Paenibacillus lautus TaxID=1401 RepID=UPI002DBEFB0B|nr:hypothetical protein [Paenibacillus lautus]MEC0204228.1 hypothetical protein [Paenibacillus lautus]